MKMSVFSIGDLHTDMLVRGHKDLRAVFMPNLISSLPGSEGYRVVERVMLPRQKRPYTTEVLVMSGPHLYTEWSLARIFQ